ncbi:sugar phosphate isomerase/epimerase [Jiangella asiatica]|uniref:Xylose isomerase n=2 Tax=Jiangella asiatica TaxID=2530372 RepID=A0A4R5DPB8_9ACTN|nr:sugar phosphate isomerase/epimerase [Jiangella asiatica]
MAFKHCVQVGILGRYADRFTEYQPPRPLRDRLAATSGIDGARGVELVYPPDFEDPAETAALVREFGLEVAAVNLNVKTDPVWRYGSFTNPDPAIRARAVSDLRVSMDLAADLGAGLVTVCPLIDGWDYNFQADYQKQWAWLIDGLREAASHRSDVRVSIEYKAFEARQSIIVPNMATTLHLCDRIGLDNIGVTMDVGHALIAGETPAMSAVMAHDAGRLFYVHFNDNNRAWDWDMVPGAVNLWDMLETLFYLDRLGWDGWFSYDVFTKHGDPVEAFDATIRAMDALGRMLDKLGRAELQDLIDTKSPARATEYLLTTLAR